MLGVWTIAHLGEAADGTQVDAVADEFLVLHRK